MQEEAIIVDATPTKHPRQSVSNKTAVPAAGDDYPEYRIYRLMRRAPLSATAQSRLARRAQRGDLRARDDLVRTNMRLVLSIANKHRGEGMEIEDLISEGVTGLLEGIRRFDPKKGYKLSTYVTYWIRWAMLEAWAWQGRSLRLPHRVNDDLRKLARASEELFQSLGRQPSPSELAEATSLESGRIEELLQARRYTLSLEVPAGRSDSPSEQGQRSELGQLLPDNDQGEEPARNLLREELGAALDDALKQLPEIESYIISARYGLSGSQKATLRQLAVVLGISPEGVRQRQRSAEIKLRRSLLSYSGAGGKATYAKAG